MEEKPKHANVPSSHWEFQNGKWIRKIEQVKLLTPKPPSIPNPKKSKN